MGDFLSRFIDQPSAGGITWVNLSAAASGLSTADNDPSSVASSFSSDPTGTTVTVGNATSVDGWAEGALWFLDDIVDLFPDFAEDGSKLLLIHGEVVSRPAAGASVACWQSVVVVEATDLNEGAGVGTYGGGSTDYVFGAGVTAGAGGTTVTVAGGIIGVAVFSGNGAMRISAPASTTTTAAVDTAMNAGYRLAIAAGCASSADNGPHSSKILWKAAVIDAVPS